jgi:NADH-quinone oxidoreductase subunit C
VRFALAKVVSASPGQSHAAGQASADALRQQFGNAIRSVRTSCGQVIVTVEPARAHDALAWLYRDPAQEYHYLCDVTAVEYRDPEQPFEVVYQIRSLRNGGDLRVKIPLDPRGPLEVATVTDLWSGADWLEREVFDMFGVRFRGHPDLRRILMWQTYDEGFPLRKSFPLRGHRSRSEQTRQALLANPEAHYTLEELSIVEAYHDLPEDVRTRLIQDGRVAPP